MTVEEIATRVENIRKLDDLFDVERAHIEEDRLHQDVLKAIADGANDPASLARAALQTQTLELTHWYA